MCSKFNCIVILKELECALEMSHYSDYHNQKGTKKLRTSTKAEKKIKITNCNLLIEKCVKYCFSVQFKTEYALRTELKDTVIT